MTESVVLRRCWAALFQSQMSAFWCPCCLALPACFPPPDFLSCSCPLPASLFQPFSPTLFSSPLKLRAGGPGSFSSLAAHRDRKPCCFREQRRGGGTVQKVETWEGWRNVTGEMRNRCRDPVWLSLVRRVARRGGQRKLEFGGHTHLCV